MSLPSAASRWSTLTIPNGYSWQSSDNVLRIETTRSSEIALPCLRCVCFAPLSGVTTTLCPRLMRCIALPLGAAASEAADPTLARSNEACRALLCRLCADIEMSNAAPNCDSRPPLAAAPPDNRMLEPLRWLEYSRDGAEGDGEASCGEGGGRRVGKLPRLPVAPRS